MSPRRSWRCGVVRRRTARRSPAPLPALLAEPGAVRDAAAGDPWSGAALAQLPVVDVVVVAAVGEQLARPAARSAASTSGRRGCIHQRGGPGDVLAGAPRQGDRRRGGG